MKKSGIIVLFCILAVATVMAQTPRDGFYFAQDAAYAGGLKNQVVLRVQGGKIASANWNRVTYSAGRADFKAEAAKGGEVATWANNAKLVEDFLVSSQNLNATSVSGVPANFQVAPFFNLAKQAMASTAIAKGPYNKDGWYYADTPIDPDPNLGYNTRNTALITVVNGTIVDALWNGIINYQGINPSKFIASAEGKYPMVGSQAPWHTQAERAAQALVRLGDPAKITMKANKTPDAITGCTVIIKDFIEASTKALQAAR